jgi:hypothetical protein
MIQKVFEVKHIQIDTDAGVSKSTAVLEAVDGDGKLSITDPALVAELTGGEQFTLTVTLEPVEAAMPTPPADVDDPHPFSADASGDYCAHCGEAITATVHDSHEPDELATPVAQVDEAAHIGTAKPVEAVTDVASTN